MDITIRPAKAEDYESVKNLLKQSLEHHSELRPDTYRVSDNFISTGEYSEMLSQTHILLATDSENKVYGLITYSTGQITANSVHHFHRMFIHELTVDKGCRRSGVATLLMDTVKNIAREKGVDRIQLNVNALNSGAIALYEKQGFVPEMYKMEYIIDKEG